MRTWHNTLQQIVCSLVKAIKGVLIRRSPESWVLNSIQAENAGNLKHNILIGMHCHMSFFPIFQHNNPLPRLLPFARVKLIASVKCNCSVIVLDNSKMF